MKREQIYLETEKQKIEAEKRPLAEKLNHLEKEMEEAKNILENSNKKDGKSRELLEIENEIKKENYRNYFLWVTTSP